VTSHARLCPITQALGWAKDASGNKERNVKVRVRKGEGKDVD